MAAVVAVLVAEAYALFVFQGGSFRVQGVREYDLTEIGAGRTISHAFLMRGDGLNAVNLRFSSPRKTEVTVQWRLWRGMPDLPETITLAFEGTEQFILRAGRQWKPFSFTRDGSSRDRWYTFEVRLLKTESVSQPSAATPASLALVASSDNPERGGVLWIDKTRQPGSLVLRADRQGRTLLRRFEAEVEPHLPALLQIGAVQWTAVIAVNVAMLTVALALLRDARPYSKAPKP